MISPRIAFKISMSHYANDKHYRRAQNAYLLLLLLLVTALWPGLRTEGGPTYLSLTVFLSERLIPVAFLLMQFRLGIGLDHSADEVPPERLPAPGRISALAAVVAAELIHTTAQWALQAPLIVAAVAAAGLDPGESLRYLAQLLAFGYAARFAGVLARVLVRRPIERRRARHRGAERPRAQRLAPETEPETTYSRSSDTVSK